MLGSMVFCNYPSSATGKVPVRRSIARDLRHATAPQVREVRRSLHHAAYWVFGRNLVCGRLRRYRPRLLHGPAGTGQRVPAPLGSAVWTVLSRSPSVSPSAAGVPLYSLRPTVASGATKLCGHAS
ncbi:hypothetical protein NDU88_009145 [Pleurodeles waltl]|uniref:Uncharacterized protein n=1 Tax=Pleurodeles waltl TaxID=8319 RepID=A0AAV7RUF5_PLEWA|nr:hypothetical protein NDU88_009145 [Pleurodeles waltl]